MDRISCGKTRLGVVKMVAVLVLAIIIVIYSILLFTGTFGKVTVKEVKRSTDPKEIEMADKTIKTLLESNAAGFVELYEEQDRYFIIKVKNTLWKKQSIKEKKNFVKNIATARATLGLNPDVKVVDTKSGIEFASYENARVTIADLDL